MSKLTVRQARLMSGNSQEKMAKLLGMHKNTYILKEKGESKFYIDEAYMFAKLVGLPFSDIIFFDSSVPKIWNIKEGSDD